MIQVMPNPEHGHIPVLLEATLEHLNLRPGLVVLDATVGRGGHASAIIPQISGGILIATDLDAGNVTYSQTRLRPLAQEHDVELHVLHGNFSDIDKLLQDISGERLEIVRNLAGFDAILADLGFASNQVDTGDRGLSFREDAPLDMRLNPEAPITAEQLVNTLGEADIAELLFGLGEERLSRKIARKIVEERQKQPITRTSQLSQIVRSAYGPSAHRQRIDPATRTFMALRIAVNDELGSLERLLESLAGLVRPGGRVAVISFHSLEDRRVKQTFTALANEADGKRWQRVTRKPITATSGEAVANPRSRSAKLRVLERREI